MKVVIADTGALISLGQVDQIQLIEKVFGEFYIAQAVWEELNQYEHPNFPSEILSSLSSKTVKITSKNHLAMVMDYDESESVILYEELKADFLLIDDNKARVVAESLDINCVGSIGLLLKAKQKGFIKELKPIFQAWLNSDRYFSLKLLNTILIQAEETPIDLEDC